MKNEKMLMKGHVDVEGMQWYWNNLIIWLRLCSYLRIGLGP